MFVQAECERDLGLDGLSDDELVERLRADEVERRRYEADQALTVRELDRRKAYRRDGHASIRGLVRVVTKRANWEVTALVQTGRLMEQEPTFADAFRAGRVGVRQAHELARARAHKRCGDELTGAHLDDLLDEAIEGSYPSFHTAIKDWVNLHDADGADQSGIGVDEGRDAWFGTVGDEFVGRINGSITNGEAIIEIFEAFVAAELDRDWTWTVAHYGPEPALDLLPRTVAQRRHDAFVAMCVAAVAAPAAGDDEAPASTPSADPVVNLVGDPVTVGRVLAKFLGVEDLPDESEFSDIKRRCHTASGRAVAPIELLRALVAGYLRRVVLDERGVVIDMGRKRRLFRGNARIAAHMDQHRCCWPGCELPASRCDTDHLTDWAHGGCTCPHDGAPLCPRHNRWKNHGYTIRRDARGRLRTYRPDGTEVA